MTELSNEINHIQVYKESGWLIFSTTASFLYFPQLDSIVKSFQSEIASAKDEQSTYLSYEKRVKEAAAELTEQQSKLADFNLLVDKQNTDTEVIFIIELGFLIFD